MSNTLFELAQSIRNALDVVDQETGEILDFDQSKQLFEQKGVACIAYLKDEAARIDAGKKMLAEMTEAVKKKEKRLEAFKEYIASCMKSAGITDIAHDSGVFGAKLYLDRDESLEIVDASAIPADLYNDPKPLEPSKTKIKAALKAGQVIDGVRIVKKDRLTIK